MTVSLYKVTRQLALLSCLLVACAAARADTVTVTYTGDTTTNFPNPERMKFLRREFGRPTRPLL